MSKSKDLGEIGLRIAFTGAAFVAPSFFHFSMIFPRRFVFSNRYVLFLIYFTGVIFAYLALFTGQIIHGITLLFLGYKADYGSAYPFFGLFFVGTMGFALWLILHKYYASPPELKPQIRFILVGTMIAVVGATITNLLIPIFTGVSFYSRYGPLALLPFVVLTTYAIIRHNLLNIKVIATELLASVLIFIIFIKFLLSQGVGDFIINAVILSAVSVIGIFLIKAVYKEVHNREKIAELARQLTERNTELKKLDNAKSEFISIASHQLRTPLTIIRGYLSMLLENSFGKLDKNFVKPLRQSMASTEELINLVNDLLDLSRIEAGRLQYDFQPIVLGELVKKAVLSFEESAKSKHLGLNFADATGASGRIFGDFYKLYEAISNLIDNAIKYSQKGIITVKLEEVETSDRERKIRLSVRDTGMGIRQEDINRLFTKFWRSEEAQKTQSGGMGIGLYLVKRIVEDHKGRVWVESEGSGLGSTFFVELSALN